jgi:hypothetical protein
MNNRGIWHLLPSIQHMLYARGASGDNQVFGSTASENIVQLGFKEAAESVYI